jgi:hypothetical protein
MGTIRMIAFCGLDCTTCSACLATQADDIAEKECVAARWRKETGEEEIDVDYVTCDGCLAFGGQLGGHCRECKIRACAVVRGVENCGHCPNYPCANLDAVFRYASEARERLDKIRRSLPKTGGETGG